MLEPILRRDRDLAMTFRLLTTLRKFNVINVIVSDYIRTPCKFALHLETA